MNPTSYTRWRLWVPLLLGAAALALFGDKTPSDRVVAPTTTTDMRPSPAARTPVSGATDRVALPASSAPQWPLESPIDRSRLYPLAQSPRPTRDLFAAVSWLPAPLAPTLAPSPATASGPALPTFTVVGKKYEALRWEVYLAHGDRTLIAREGATIDDGLRVDRIAPPTMSLTMLSTGQTMTVHVGEAR